MLDLSSRRGGDGFGGGEMIERIKRGFQNCRKSMGFIIIYALFEVVYFVWLWTWNFPPEYKHQIHQDFPVIILILGFLLIGLSLLFAIFPYDFNKFIKKVMRGKRK